MSVIACSGGTTDPQAPTYPDVAGTYTVQGGFDRFTASDASFAGSITFSQPDRHQGTLTATAHIILRIGTTPSTLQDVQSAAVQSNGAIAFALADGDWKFTGTVSGTQMSGSHQLPGKTTTFTGRWTASR